ncbi:MAG: T9SS type A sorting domain-containing protein [Dysgonamonadaceae bacterium]|jgi:hypothetical protein|nr:T9SS type A sorting domain-containing protein [Dysgonamonadaceae bacterium]
MRKILMAGIILMRIVTFINAQERGEARGTVSGELYMAEYWYGIYNQDWGPPVFDTLVKALFHITDHGKKITLPYAADAFAHKEDYPYFDSTVVVPVIIIADATPGVLYNRSTRYSLTLDTWLHGMWVSFDYGKTWTFREENRAPKYYYASNFERLIYRMQSAGYDHSVFKSTNYGDTWQLISDKGYMFRGECGFDSSEFFGISGNYPTDPWSVYYTINWFDTYSITPIGEQYVFGNMNGIFPDIYRGALPGEVYVSSWFPDYTFKVSFSADTGHTFRVVYHSDSLYFLGENRTFYLFMSDRAAGVFYIIYNETVEMDEPWGQYAKICISHYSNYGETLVGTYCHDLMMNYLESCEGVLDMEAEVRDDNNVALRWHPPQAEQPILVYYLYRDNMLLAELQQTDYLDENLPNGSYTYHVRVMYVDSCKSLSYNTVKVTINFTGIADISTGSMSVRVYPNPTRGELRVEVAGQARNDREWRVESVEVFDLMGKSVGAYHCGSSENTKIILDISNTPAGMYFVRIQTETGVIVKKVIKQ